MPDLVYGSGAVEQARTAVAGEARRVPALADLVAPVPAAALGGLAGAGELAAALDRLRGALATDLAAAGDRLGALDRALDATLTSMQATDGGAAASLSSLSAPSSPSFRPGR